MPRTATTLPAVEFNATGFKALVSEFNKLVTEMEELKTIIAAHKHGGVTAGSGDSAAPNTITYAATAAKLVE